MSDRIHACLDGELAIEQLTADERAQVELVRAAAGTLAASLPAAPAGLEAAVLRRIHALPAEQAAHAPAGSAQSVSARATETAGSRLGRVLRGLWQPRPIMLRPVYAAVAVVLMLLLVARPDPAREAPAALAEAPPMYVQFRLDAAGASSVVLAGSFTEWQLTHELVETQPGTWTIMVALPPGVHDYAFLVDGTDWVVDPAAATVQDGFGGVNSRIALLPAL